MMAEARSSSRLRWLAAVAAAGVPLTLALLWLRTSTRERGSQLFHGGAALSGRLTGHDEPLPADSTQCQNCHQLESEPAAAAPKQTGAAAELPVEKVGPKLGSASLTRAAKRRGGPSTAYTADAFCRLLREGVDPAQIVIPQLMPRYTVTDAECNALWAYLISN
jgi:hypothetical protein